MCCQYCHLRNLYDIKWLSRGHCHRGVRSLFGSSSGWAARNVVFLHICLLFYSFDWYGGFLKWWYPQTIHFNRVFHYKPSILGYPGYPYFWKHPYEANKIKLFDKDLEILRPRHGNPCLSSENHQRCMTFSQKNIRGQFDDIIQQSTIPKKRRGHRSPSKVCEKVRFGYIWIFWDGWDRLTKAASNRTAEGESRKSLESQDGVHQKCLRNAWV